MANSDSVSIFNSKTMLPRALWVLLLFVLLAAIPLMNKYRGGDIESQTACALASSRVEGADDSVLIFGSSRIISFLDHFYMNDILQNEPGLEDREIESLALLGRDAIASYFLLENRIMHGEAPELVVLELMVNFSSAGMREREHDLRHTALFEFDQLARSRTDFQPGNKRLGVIDYVSIAADRTTALIYGVIENPTAKFWDVSPCKPNDDWNMTDFSAEERHVKGGAQEEVARVREFLQHDYAKSINLYRAPNSRWDLEIKVQEFSSAANPKNSRKHGFAGLSGEVALQEISALQRVVSLAEQNGADVLLIPLLDHGDQLSEEERQEIQALFPGARMFWPVQQSGSVLEAYWVDSHHMSRKGSMLPSALLTKEIAEVLRRD
jgi:hypothetical protein